MYSSDESVDGTSVMVETQGTGRPSGDVAITAFKGKSWTGLHHKVRGW